MSGGAYDYAYVRLNDFIDHVKLDETGAELGHEDMNLRQEFRDLLIKVSDAMCAIEWNDSDDGDPHEREKITACFEHGRATLERLEQK